MNNKLREIVKSLFNDGSIQLAIGFEEGNHRPRPYFCQNEEGADKLVLDKNCINNLAVYLTKRELIGTNTVALTANIPTLRSVLQLASENQLKAEQWIILTIDRQGEIVRFKDLEEIKSYLAEYPLAMNDENKKLLKEIQSMTREERWKYWTAEMSKCIKCYACRAACPLCYCSQCIVEVNRPQWIQPWAAPLSNMEWQINRVMHMSGRCVECGACSEACPVDIPLHLLTWTMTDNICKEFGLQPGDIDNKGNILSTFRVEDKEDFIR